MGVCPEEPDEQRSAVEPKILATATASPVHTYSTDQILPWLRRWLDARDATLYARMARLVEAVQIDQRSSALPIEDTFTPRSFEEKNDSYIECAIELAGRAFEQALARAGLQATDIDFIITTSCTGFMIPSLDAHLANRYRMKRALQRLPVLQMGCAGGTAALIYATDYLRAHPDHHVAVIACELPSVTLQLDDLSMANIVSTALFADGTACVLLGPTDAVRPVIVDKQMTHIHDTADVMGYRLTNSGLRIVLDRAVPEVIAANLESILVPFLARNGRTLQEVDHMIFHPGSIRILERTEAFLAPHGKHVDDAKAVLRRHGNMSSATVLFILARFVDRHLPAGEVGLMLSFGPGFMGHTLLLEWR